jgi:hypothetical protein
MPIVHALCRSFALDTADGVHQASDVYMVALYTADAILNEHTTEYAPTHEVVAPGYVAGGKRLESRRAVLDGRVPIIDFADPEWPHSSITARGALVYNASKQNKALIVVNFGKDFASVNGVFAIELPPPTKAEALIRFNHVS